MKYNKGFAPLILLAIIVGALAVGGGAMYFATKTPTSPKNVEETNYQPQENQNPLETTNNNQEVKKEEVGKQVETSIETQLKKFIREKYSFYAPKEWMESSVILSGGNSSGCELYSINYGGDGHRMGGSISIHTKSCFVSLKLPSALIKEKIEKDGYYIVAEYDESTTSSEITKTKETYKKVVETFTVNNETMSVKVYFGDTIDAQSCFTPSYVERIIPKTTAVARASIEELLKGPTEAEKLQDRWTGLNSGISIKTLTINNGIAYVDFSLPVNSQFNSQYSVNTCKTSATLIITNQIESTLKQFSTIKRVVITVNGKPMGDFIDA